jgi:subtilisin
MRTRWQRTTGGAPAAGRRIRLGALVTAVLLLIPAVAAASDVPAGVATPPPGATVVPDSYLVVLDAAHPATVARDHVRLHGAELTYLYEHAFTGYAARMPSRAAAAIARDPRVLRVEPETLETIQQQVLPTGVDRVETDRNPTVTTDGSGGVQVDVPIAVLDTGIAPHPDLNVAGRVDCTVSSGGGPFASYGCVEGQGDDGNGHGTHVAGTIGAMDNGSGVVGVAPGAPLWSVKVCPTNSCPTGAINAGIDWVAGKKASGEIDFAAANFSISSADSDNACTSPANATHAAICGVVSEGVSFVMAAGNDGRTKVPYPVGFSVSAIADFDGQAGGAGGPTCRADEDDTLATFSNSGPGVRIAAPGVCILSTWNDGAYATISGTSMAAPHVAGAVALYLHANGRSPAASAAGVRALEDAITGAALPQGTEQHPCSYDDTRLGGPLLFTNAGTFGGDGTCAIAGDDGGDPGEDPDDPDEPDDPGDPGDPGELQLSLSSSSVNAGSTWTATVTATVTDGGEPSEGVTISGTWSTGATATCVTGPDGACSVSLTGIRKSVSSVSLQVAEPSASSITVPRP